MTDFEALAKTVEAKTHNYRELECRVWCAVTNVDFDVARAVVTDFNQWQAPYYTDSLDAALTLIPEGFRVVMGNRFDRTGYASLHQGFSRDDEIKGDADSMALAVIAVALRAHAVVVAATPMKEVFDA